MPTRTSRAARTVPPRLPAPRLSPYLVVRDPDASLRFMEEALGARAVHRRTRPDGTVAHAEVRLGGVLVMVGAAADGRAFPAMLHLFVRDVEAAHARAVAAGAVSVRAPAPTGRGSTMAGVRDPWGNEWWFTRPPRSRATTAPRGAARRGASGGRAGRSGSRRPRRRRT